MKGVTYTIYAIEYIPTKKLYIGSSTQIRARYTAHIESLRAGKHRSKEWQRDYNKYGDGFSVYILEEVENGNEMVEWGARVITKHRAREYEWMMKYDTTNSGYNTQDTQAKRAIAITNKFSFPLKEGKPKLPTEEENKGE